MKYFILSLFLFLSGEISAQKIALKQTLIEKDNLLSQYLVKEISATQALQKNKEIHKRLRNAGLQAQAIEEYLYTGYIYHFENKEDSAQLFLLKGLKTVEHKNDTLHFKYLALIAGLYDSKYQLDSSQLYFKKGFDLLLQNPTIEKQMPNEAVSFYINFMFYLNRNGETRLWKDILDKTYNIAKGLKKTDYLGFVENQLAEYYYRISDTRNQERMYLLSISHTNKPFHRLGRYLSLAKLYQNQNQWNKYERLFPLISKDLSEILENSRDFNRLKLNYHFLYARWLFHKNENQTAKKLILSQLALENRFRTIYEPEAYLMLADNSSGIEEKSFLTKAISSSLVDENHENLSIKNVLFPEQLIKALKNRIQNEKEDNNQDEIRQTLSLINQIQKAFPFEETKYSFQEDVRPFLGELIDRSLDNAGNAFRYIEYGKAIVLNQVISDLEIKFSNVEPRLLKQEKDFAQQLTRLRVELAKQEKAPDSLMNEIDKLRIKQSFLQKEMEQKSANYYALKYKDNIPEVTEVQKSLNNNEAILSYLKQGQYLYAVVIKRNEKKIKRIVLQPNFNETLNLFLKGISTNPGFGEFNLHQTARKLHKQLLGELEKELKGISELVILRDGELNQLPFEVLETPDGKLLLDKYAISYNYSASLTLPKFKAQKLTNLLAFAPYTNGSFINSLTRDMNLAKLPFSSLEVDQINGTIYKDQSATKTRFLQDYKKHGIIHFATHAQMDDKDPSRSFIAFYPDSSDYKLYTDELYNLSLQNTQLIVLSACEAGGGKLQQGEGLMSLARGFTYAGCPAVITTLWKANDQSTAWLSERLHHYLKKGWNKSNALRQAKLDFRESDIGQEFDHPYYWANFILIGDDEPLQLTFWNTYRWWIIGSIIFAALFLLAIWIFRKKN